MLFVLVGISPMIPFWHMLVFVDPANYIHPNLYEWSVGGAIYIFGALLYGTRFPERLFPGKLDILGQSHQIFHVLVLIAAFLHFDTSLKEFNKRQL